MFLVKLVADESKKYKYKIQINNHKFFKSNHPKQITNSEKQNK